MPLTSFESLTKKQQERLKKSLCPDCGGTLYEGPSGGMSQNILCGNCYEEFVFHGMGCFDRNGKIGQQRAMRAYGIGAQPMIVSMWVKPAKQPLLCRWGWHKFAWHGVPTDGVHEYRCRRKNCGVSRRKELVGWS